MYLSLSMSWNENILSSLVTVTKFKNPGNAKHVRYVTKLFFKKIQIHEMHFYSLIEHPRSNDIFWQLTMGRFCEKIVESWVISMVVVCSSRVTLSKEPHPWIYERRMVFIQKSGGHQKILGEVKSKMDEFMNDSIFTIANINLKKLRWRIEVRR